MSYIKGIQKTTLVDYPGKVAATVFIAGCNFRCPFCHNSALVLENQYKELTGISEDELIEYLAGRIKQLDGICITGGEPTIHEKLPQLIRKIKALGYAVKLDTNGTNPEMLKALLAEKLLDFIAMDVKGPLELYPEIVRTAVDQGKIKASIDLIINSDIQHEFRTTVLPVFYKPEHIDSLRCLVRGADAYILQQYRTSEGVLDENFQNEVAYTAEELQDLADSLQDSAKKVAVRGLA